jgi:hypothetical protein
MKDIKFIFLVFFLYNFDMLISKIKKKINTFLSEIYFKKISYTTVLNTYTVIL